MNILYIDIANYEEYNDVLKTLEEMNLMEILCEKCWYNTYDEETDEYFCNLQIDEDEYVRFILNSKNGCKFFRPDGGEYEIVRRQN